jgi:hypothetical protein
MITRINISQGWVMNKTKNQKKMTIPDDIPIIWVNII